MGKTSPCQPAKPPHELKLAHIITAAPQALGFNITDVLLGDLTPATRYEVLSKFDIIYVQGGNGFYLLKQARACGFEHAVRKILEDRTKWYIGVSAGTYIACPTIEMHNWKRAKDRHGLADVMAMDMVPSLIVAHYNRDKYREVLAQHLPTATCPVKILTDDQAFLVQNGAVTLIGDGPEILARRR